MKSDNQDIIYKNIKISIKREDLLHAIISGNKFRKLKYNLIEVKNIKYDGIITFGGAYSNHIIASAYAAKINDLMSIGYIRGEELISQPLNQTLQAAEDYGMSLKFISREDYRAKTDLKFINELKKNYPKFYIIDEGGTNQLAIKGCEEILTEVDKKFDYICAAVGTGGTISGLINSSENHQKVLGFSALNENYLESEINKYVVKTNWQLIRNYHLGGYAKTNEKLIHFMNDFYDAYQIPLDPIYTGKMLFGIFDMIDNNFFQPNCHILVIHTGGLQAISGMNNYLKKTSQPIIKYEKYVCS